MLPHIGPFRDENAVHYGISYRTVGPRLMMTENSVPLGAQSLDRSLRAEIEVVGSKADNLAPQFVKSVFQQQKFASRVDVATLPALWFLFREVLLIVSSSLEKHDLTQIPELC